MFIRTSEAPIHDSDASSSSSSSSSSPLSYDASDVNEHYSNTDSAASGGAYVFMSFNFFKIVILMVLIAFVFMVYTNRLEIVSTFPYVKRGPAMSAPAPAPAPASAEAGVKTA